MSRCMRFAALCVLIAAALVPSACSKRLQNSVGLLNQPPTIQIEAPTVSNGGGEFVTARVHWTATDIDGRVDHYLVTRDLSALSRESGWTTSAERERTLGFRRATSAALVPTQPSRDGFEFLAVRAVDDQGAVSVPATLALFDDNVAPTVTIVSPHPQVLLIPQVPPDLRIRWVGSDPDGPDGRPAKYKYKLWKRDSSLPWNAWLMDPDSLRRQFAPNFSSWDSTCGDSTSVRVTGLDPSYEYLFVITALDAQGAYDPVFSLSKNMLRMHVGWVTGPRITLFNETFQYQYVTGGSPDVVDSSSVVRIQASALRPLTVNWYGDAAVGSVVCCYRWALDIADLRDELPRHNRFDLSHWSAWDLATTSATIDPTGPRAVTGTHRLYVEAQDDFGRLSLGVVEFTLVSPVFDRDLLIVDDTRFQVDMKSTVQPAGRTDSLRAPYGVWPTRAELDTFLFAVGGVRWRMAPAGRLSPQGIFRGYRFDTLGTRRGLADPTLPLDVLGHYRHIVWITDAKGSEATGPPNSLTTPTTTLRYISAMNRQNSLAPWVEGGGKLWALGGGFGNATNSPWNNFTNDSSQTRTYSSGGTRPDLVPGRFMYDLTHWQSEFKCIGPCLARVARAPFPPAGRPGTPLYGLLPAALNPKQPATDPIWPYRMAADFFYGNPAYSVLGSSIEYLSKPNHIIDDWNPAPWCARDVSVLDTLMVATGVLLPAPGANPAVDRIVNPVMTHYRGRECGPVVFSGFDCWTWSRADCASLVDAVLQGIWQLQRDPGTGATVKRRPGPVTTPATPPGSD